MQLYRSGHYKEAVAILKKAVAQNPTNIEAHLGLAAAYGSQYVPGSTDEGSRDSLREALAEYQTVLQLDPSNEVALESLGQLAYYESITNKSRLDEAAKWFRKLASLNSSNEQARYFLGVIAWSKSYASVAQARQKLGIPADAQGPLPDEATRQSLATQYDSIVDEGIENLREALAIKPDNEDAMTYINLLLRVRAALGASAEDSARDIAEAERWSQLSLETRRQKQGPPSEQATPKPPTISPPLSSQAPSADIPEISAQAAEANLESKVEAIYPPLALSARVQGQVVFRITIGDDGRVKHMALERGHPLLVKAARDAVLQYVYRPVLLDGHPTAVQTTVTVQFSLP